MRKKYPDTKIEQGDHVGLLMEQLRKVLIHDGVLRPDAYPNGPNLILAATDYVSNGESNNRLLKEARDRLRKAPSTIRQKGFRTLMGKLNEVVGD